MARPIYALFGKPDRLAWHVNEDPGTHNFLQDNREALYRALQEHFYRGSESFDAAEIASDNEIKTREELEVPLPDDNATFNTLAIELSKSLPRDGTLPSDKSAAVDWQQRSREELNELIRSGAVPYTCVAQQQDSFTRDDVRITYWRLAINDEWTVPAVEFAGPDAKGVAVLVNDQGRMSDAAAVHKWLSSGYRVLAVDPFYFGEAKISQKDNLFALLVASVGHRPLGIQANQLAAVARWCRDTYDQPVTLVAHGPRSSTFSLIAAGVEPRALQTVHLHGAWGSLKQVVETNQTVNQMPELFCFGLLERFDIRQLAALVAPRPVTFHDPSDRARVELTSLAEWYKTLGVDHDPLPRVVAAGRENPPGE